MSTKASTGNIHSPVHASGATLDHTAHGSAVLHRELHSDDSSDTLHGGLPRDGKSHAGEHVDEQSVNHSAAQHKGGNGK